MSKKLLLKLCTIFFITILFSCSSESSKDISTEKSIKNEIETYISKWNYKPALSVSVYGKNGKINFSFAYGKDSISKNIDNSLETEHYLYSITKSFVAASILKLENEKKLDINQPISKYLGNLNEIYINLDATIEELLNHRSGIYDYTDSASMFYNNPFINESWSPHKILSFIKIPATNRGEFNYSSANYILLGLIIEKISGQELNHYISDNFFNPFNFSLKLYPQDNADFLNFAHPHVFPNTKPLYLAGDGTTPIDAVDIIPNLLELLGKCSWAAGGIYGKINDISRWGFELLSENGNIDNKIKNEILSSVSNFSETSIQEESYGFGIRKIFHNNKEFIGSYGRWFGK